MLRDGELAGREYVQLVCAGLPNESEVNLVSSTLPQVHGACLYYVDSSWISTGTGMVSDTARQVLATAEPGGSLQLAWAGACVQTARTDEELATLRGWLDGVGVPKGLRIDTDLRWSILSALVANGRAGEAEIEAEYDRDRTASGELSAATARALIPSAEAKAEAWRKITGPTPPNNSLQRAILHGFYHPVQLALTEPYVARFLDVLDTVWSTRDSEVAQEFVTFGYPTAHVSQETYDAVAAWLAGDHAAGLRKMVVEGHDATARGLRGRAKDRNAS
jgi:aminopeptidase N